MSHATAMLEAPATLTAVERAMTKVTTASMAELDMVQRLTEMGSLRLRATLAMDMPQVPIAMRGSMLTILSLCPCLEIGNLDHGMVVDWKFSGSRVSIMLKSLIRLRGGKG